MDGAEKLRRRFVASSSPYQALHAHIYWIKGMAEATLGKTQEGIVDLKTSLKFFEDIGENENAANINCRLGDVLMSRGRRNQGWASIYRALRATPELRDPDKVLQFT